MKRKLAKFLMFFLVMIIFSVVEDMVALSTITLFSWGIFLAILPEIVLIALLFTIITEYIEERMFHPEDQPIKNIIKAIDNAFRHMQRHKIKPTPANVKKHVKVYIKK